MRIKLTTDKPEKLGTDVIGLLYRAKGENPAFEALNRRLRGALAEAAQAEKFKGQKDRTVVWQGRFGGRQTRVFVAGVGSGDVDAGTWRRAVGRAVRYTTGHRLTGLVLLVDDADSARGVRLTAEALVLSDYRFDRYKAKKSRSTKLKDARIGLHGGEPDLDACRVSLRLGKAAAEGVCLARDLVNEPANVLSPAALADRAAALAEKKKLECTVLDRAGIEKQGMSLLLAVAAGSSRDPRLVHLVYRPKQEPRERIVLVGKGLTFDAGGLCIKPGPSMYDMKTDMGGAATTMGIMSALGTFAPPVEVHAIIPCSDNMINGEAMRPGDVIESLGGATVEVLNTDAEGRLILADALAYAKQLEPDLVIDHATLTGACLVALGAHRAGLFGNRQDAVDAYLGAARDAGELLWHLPLADELDKSLKSDVADVKNMGGRWGGAITAALFLKRFVGEHGWLHVDIAGPARADGATPTCPKGATGFGVLTGLTFLDALAEG